ncbi:Glucose-1-phosphate adenylyltransferase [bioreactor metagenome]|uniref:Glucose-1-phosphate adenylyltransferase n=1 Tax=bioreactor metagenome TaxID=1076179 RepID=A0A644TPG7_9ZZZZ
MKKKCWERCKVSAESTIRDTMKRIDESALQIALVVDEENKLLGVVTDGDIRRAILHNDSLDRSVVDIMSTNPITVHSNRSRGAILAKLQEKKLNCIPVVDDNNIVVDIVSLQELTYQKRRENAVVLMVGGLGTRLSPLTNKCPKPLLEVGNKPILETILENFIEAGFYRFYFAVNYKSDMIEEYFGDGSRFGVEIRYIHEKKRMGTAGALSLLPEKMKLPVIVMNGDLLTKVDFGQLLDYHDEKKAVATMAVREYCYQIPYGVINFEEGRIIDIQEKPEQSFFVNAGIYVLSPEAIVSMRKEEFFDMPDLFNEIIGEGKMTAAFPIREYWLDIGKMDDFEKAQDDFEEMFT